MAIGDVKDLIVRFFAKDWEPVKAKIDSIPDHKTVKIDFETSGFSAALAELAAFARSMDTIERSLGGGGGRDGPGFLSRLFFRGFGGLNLPGPLGSLPSFFTSAPGLLALAGAAAAAASAVTALVNGFAAAAAGAGAFGLLAMPTFKAVSGAVTQIATDTLAYQNATTAAAKSDALKKIKADWSALDPAQRQAVRGVQAFQKAWAEAAQAFEPQAMKIFNDVLKIANSILPALAPLATAFSTALDPLLKKLDTFLQSPGFKDWLKKFTSLIGPAVTAFGSGFGRMVNDIGKLLTTFSGKDVAHAINTAFDIIDAAIRAFTWIVNSSRTAWDWISRVGAPAVEHAFDNVQHAVGNTKHAWDNVSHAIDNVRHAFGNVGHAIDNIVHAFDNVMHAVHNFQHAIDNARHFVAVAAVDIWHALYTAGQKIGQFFTVDIPHWISVGVSWFKRLPGMILSAIGNLGNLLFHVGESIIQGLINGIKAMASPLMSVLHWITSLIPFSKGPIEKDRMLLYPSGQAIMAGLMGGIGSQVPALNRQLAGITTGIGGSVRGHGVGVGGGITINVTVSPGTSPNETARAIQKMLLQLKRTNGGAALGLA